MRRSPPPLPGRGPDALIRDGERRYRAAVRHARRHPTSAAIHAVRTSTRRLEALATVLGRSPDDAVVRKLKRQLRVAFRASGRLRDLQIAERLLRKRCRTDPTLDALLDDVGKTRRRALLKARKTLRRTRLRRVRRFLRRLTDRRLKHRPVAEARAFDAALATAQRRARRTSERTAPSVDVRSLRELHAYRLALKAERYLLELAAARGVEAVRTPLRRLRAIQNRLGHLTDRAVLLRLIARYLEEHPSRVARLAAFRGTLQAQQARALARWRKVDPWKRYDGPETTARFNRRQ